MLRNKHAVPLSSQRFAEGADSSKCAGHSNWMNSQARDVLSTVSKKDSIPAKELVLVNIDALSTVSKT